MTLDELKRLIQTADWFANLGTATVARGVVHVTDLAWQRFMRVSTGAEFAERDLSVESDHAKIPAG